MLDTIQPHTLADRYLGALLGLAVGDAVGTTLEFKKPGTFKPISDMVGGGPFRLKPGQWTDDTSVALCLAQSLVETGANDPADQMRRYLAWRDEGYLSSTGSCFDVGATTSQALTRFQRTGEPLAGSTDPLTAGNGSLMRLAPIPMAFAKDVRRACEEAAIASRTTHAAREAVDACRFMTALICHALHGATKDALLRPDAWQQANDGAAGPLAPKIAEIAQGSYARKMPPAIRGGGYVVESLEAALWCFARHDTFEQAVLAAANLGDDADTTAAIVGQLAGAHYGVTGIPARWLEKLAMRDLIAQLAQGLLAMATR